MSWTAIIPVRLGRPRKTRLAGGLTPLEREQLADRLFDHVATIVRTHPQIAETIILSPLPPPCPLDSWQRDEGRGLNAELEIVCALLGSRDRLIVHADLPMLEHADLSQLIGATEGAPVAIAPDHRGEGTNALAMRSGSAIPLAFGPGSLAAHKASARAAGARDAPLVVSPGLAHDIDCPEDLVFAFGGSTPGLRNPPRWTLLTDPAVADE